MTEALPMGDTDLKCDQPGIMVFLRSNIISTLYEVQIKFSLFFIKMPYCI